MTQKLMNSVLGTGTLLGLDLAQVEERYFAHHMKEGETIREAFNRLYLNHPQPVSVVNKVAQRKQTKPLKRFLGSSSIFRDKSAQEVITIKEEVKAAQDGKGFVYFHAELNYLEPLSAKVYRDQGWLVFKAEDNTYTARLFRAHPVHDGQVRWTGNLTEDEIQ